MKFSKQLLYNSVAEWRQYYMMYGELKKYLSRLKKITAKEASEQHRRHMDVNEEDSIPPMTVLATSPELRISRTASSKVLSDMENDFLLDNGRPQVPTATGGQYGATDDNFTDSAEFAEVERAFFHQIHLNAKKVEAFYIRMERELKKISASLVKHAIDSQEKPPEERDAILISLRRRYVEHYLELAELLNFANLNKTGFEKILKKHDKVTMLHRKDEVMRELNKYQFSHPGDLEAVREEVEEEFARWYWDGDVDRAREELQESLRELVIWERNTIWRDMLLSERRVRAVTSKKAGKGMKDYWMPSLKPVPFLICVTVFLAVWSMSPVLFEWLPNAKHYSVVEIGASQRCLSLVVLVSFLWATEAIPLYVTALAIPTLAVTLRVFIGDDEAILSANEAARLVISSMSSSVIMLIIGGYSLAAALSKYGLDKTVATLVLTKGGSPSQVLLLLMLLAVFLSMWISNVATPVLLNSVMLPIVRGFPPNALPLVKCMLLGIALASNIGGMGTPIASPQNAVALNVLQDMQQISFLQWMMVTLPLMLLMVLSCHALLIAWFRPGDYSLPIIPSHTEELKPTHFLILTTLLATVFLWCFKPALDVFGNDGIVSCLPVLVFFGLGILSKEDFNNLPWNVIYLVAGGVSLGAAVQSSKLLQIVGGAIHLVVRDSPLWMVCAVFCSFIFVVSSATSHTVSAIIIMPLMAEIGAGLGHPRLLVMGGALACSCAMALPVSSFPNTASVCVENEIGKPYLHASDILKLGVQMTIIAAIILLTIGYVLMLLLGF